MWRVQIWSGTDENGNNITPTEEDVKRVEEYCEEQFKNFHRVGSWNGGVAAYFKEEGGKYGGADWGQMADEIADQVSYEPSGISIDTA